MHSLRVQYFSFTEKIGAPQRDILGLMYLLSRIFLSYNINSTDSRVLILYGAFDFGAALGINSIERSTSLWGGNSRILVGNTSKNCYKIGYFFKKSSSSTSLPLSLEICIANNTHPLWRVDFGCIVGTILTVVGFLFPCNFFLSSSSSRRSIALS